jgi:hypothetical protein
MSLRLPRHSKRIAKIVQPTRLVLMAVWSESYCLLKHQDGLVDVTEIAKALKATGQ